MASTELSLKKVALVMLRFSFGSAVLVLPYTVLQIGVLNWIFSLIVMITVMMYTCDLTKRSCLLLYESYNKKEDIVLPYITLAEYVGRTGIFGKIVKLTLHSTFFTTSVALVLLTATILDELYVLPGLSHYNRIRLWSTMIVLLMSLFMYFKDNLNVTVSTVLALVTSFTTLVVILILSNMLKHKSALEEEKLRYPKIWNANFFVTFGTMIFAMANPLLILPDLAVLATTPQKLRAPVVFTFFIIFIIYMIGGLSPYHVLGNKLFPSVTTTFSSILKIQKRSLNSILTLVKVSSCLHLYLAAILSMRSLFRNLSEADSTTSSGFSWRRVLTRIVGLLLLLAVALLIPNFQPVLSFVGGLPITLCCIIFPLIIYARLFDLSGYEKFLFTAIMIFFLVFMVANFVVNIKHMVDVIKQKHVII